MLRPTFLAATLVVASACHDDPKPASVPLPATTASGVDAVQVPPAAMTSAPLVIEDHRIVVNGKELLDLPEDQSAGLDPKYKRNGKNDLYVVPLAASFARDAGTWPSPLTIDVDDRTSYRVLIEVLYTLGQSEIASWELRRRGHAETLPITAPRFDASALSGAPSGMHLAVLALDGGIAVKTSGGNLTPGCSAIGAGLTLPKQSGNWDLAGLDACLRSLKATATSEHLVTFSASPSLPFAEVWRILDVTRGAKRDLFPDVQLAVSR